MELSVGTKQQYFCDSLSKSSMTHTNILARQYYRFGGICYLIARAVNKHKNNDRRSDKRTRNKSPAIRCHGIFVSDDFGVGYQKFNSFKLQVHKMSPARRIGILSLVLLCRKSITLFMYYAGAIALGGDRNCTSTRQETKWSNDNHINVVLTRP